MADINNVAKNIWRQNSPNFSLTNSIGVGVNAAASLMGLPIRAVGYGQTPYIPIDPKIENFNKYIIRTAHLMYNAAGIANQLGMDPNITASIQSILDKIDLPISSRLIMFQAVDNGNPDWRFPLLVLPVNPDSFKVSYKKKSDLVYTLGGFVVTHWHDDVITITGSGYIPSFKGKSKVLAESYQYFLKFLDLYLSCGQIERESILYSTPLSTKTDVKELISTVSTNNQTQSQPKPAEDLIKSVQHSEELKVTLTSLQRSTIWLRYQDDAYNGIFTQFDIDETQEQPNTLKYTFTFKAMERINVTFGSLAAHQSIFGAIAEDSIPTLNNLFLPKP
jgi:hypothetical protein